MATQWGSNRPHAGRVGAQARGPDACSQHGVPDRVLGGRQRLRWVLALLVGAVRGDTFYGVVQTLSIGGPDDASDGRQWNPDRGAGPVPATLARWFGFSVAELRAVFPSLAAFPSPDLVFPA